VFLRRGKDAVALKQLIITIFESSGKGPRFTGEEIVFLVAGLNPVPRSARKT